MVATVEERAIAIYEDYVGQTEATRFVEIRARVSGFLDKIHFEEGTLVEEGDLLYEIDPRPFQAKMNRLKAQHQRVVATKDRVDRDLTRMKPLYERNAASQKDYDDAVAAAEEAAADVIASEAQLEEAQLEFDYCKIHSPIRGLIGESLAHEGALVGSGGQSLLVVVQNIDPIYVRFNVTPKDLRRILSYEKSSPRKEDIDKWQSVTVTLPDGSEYEFKGDVAFTDPQVNPQTGTFAVRALLPNPEQILSPGQYTAVRLRLGWDYQAILIPQRAVQAGLGGPYVMVIQDGNIADERFVTLGKAWEEDDIVIEEGLRAGETIIVEGMHKVRSGQEVRIADSPENEGSGSGD
jgi:membrane fusion protein (multidrug efflux system)